MNYEELVELLKKEKESSALSKVDESLYEDMKKLVEEKEVQSKQGGILLLREYENAKKLVEKVKEERLKKIFYFALRGISPSNAIEKELVIYEEFKAIISSFNEGKLERKKSEIESKEDEKQDEEEVINNSFVKEENENYIEIEKEKNEEKEERREKESNKRKIKIVRFVEAYRGLDGNVYGPYSVGEIVELSKDEADWLVESGYAEES